MPARRLSARLPLPPPAGNRPLHRRFFSCHKASLAVEIDGGVHLYQEKYDQQRELSLRDRGLRVLRFTNADVEYNMEAVLNLILSTCEQQGAGGEVDG